MSSTGNWNVIISGKKDTGLTATYEQINKPTITSRADLMANTVSGLFPDALAVKENNTLALLNEAIKALEINKDNKTAAATENKDTLYSNISNEDIQKWVSDSARKAGDITVIEKATTTKDADGKETKTSSGYYVVLFQERNDNLMKLQNVRHILIQFEGGKTDDKTGETVYSDTEKATAEKKAKDVLVAAIHDGDDDFIGGLRR
jgi:hypothetical protein